MPAKKQNLTVKVSSEVLDLAFEKALEILKMARVWLCRPISPYPYFAPIASLLKFVKVIGCDTVAVDKWGRIYFNPFFVLSFHPKFPKGKEISENSLRQFLETCDVSDYPINVLVEILRHEIEHLFRQHHRRAELLGLNSPDEREKWNIAADLEINQHIHCPYLHPIIYLPEKVGLPNGLSAEEYYLKLPDQPPSSGRSGSGGDGDEDSKVIIEAEGHNYPVLPQRLDEGGSGAGVPKDYELDPNDLQGKGASEAQVRARIEESARQIKEYAKSRGTVPADLVGMAEKILNPQLNWRQILAHLIRKARTNAARGKEDYTFLYPNRREEAHHPFVIPSMVQYDPDAIAAVLDTSGSMSMAELERALAEILGIARQGNVKVDVYMCDAAVHKIVRDVKTFSQVKEVIGGGGTDMVEGINRALQERRRRRYNAIVVLTDGYSPFPPDPTPIPLVICLVGKNHEDKSKMPSWAKVVEVED
jgi:predicted metal-dependent peptidase